MAKTFGEMFPNGQGWDNGGWGEREGGRKYMSGPGGKGAYFEDHGPAPSYEHLATIPGVPRVTPTGKEKGGAKKGGKH